MEITSVNNDLVRETVKLQQRKYRDKENKFLLEGYKSISEAFQAGIDILQVFVHSEKVQSYEFLREKIIGTNENVLKKISTTDTPPDAVAVAKQRHYALENIQTARKVVLLENVRDLGNLGTILRTSVAFGVEAVILYGDCADIYNPKCVRSSVGNLWKIPVISVKEIKTLQSAFKNYQKIATLPHTDKYLKDFTVELPSLVMFGSEADGLSQELIDLADEKVKIEMSENVESLNLSVSCAVVLYEMFVDNYLR